MFKLIIEDDEGKTTVVPLIRDEITIGRKEGNTIRLTERNVSRKHAKLSRQNGSVFIEDLSSYTGTKLNGDRINGRQPVAEGDRIQIGDYQLALQSEKAKSQADGGLTAPIPKPAADDRTKPFTREEQEPTGELDLAPTVQTPLAAQAEGPARLVVVSSNFPGQEFIVDKPSIVIGRTDENDVVINHRSISRHHAKVVREGAKFHILDLQSANGVRVNGEEYGKVELRKGDHIDLGHVRLRFVAPGEDFIFERDAEIVDVGGGTRSVFAAVVVVVLLAAVGGGGFMWWRNKGQSGTNTQTDSRAHVLQLNLEAENALKAEDWDTVIRKCDDALKLDPMLEVARDKRQKAMSELTYRRAFQEFEAAVGRNDLDKAVAHYRDVNEESVYRARMASQWPSVKDAYLRGHMEAAKRARVANQCDTVRTHVEAVLAIEEENKDAKDLIRSCSARATAPVAQPGVPPTKKPRDPKPPDAVAAAAATKKSPDKPPPPEEPAEATPNPAIERILQEAQESYVHGSYAQAIDQAKKAVRAQPAKAWRIIGASNCFLKDRAGAVAAWNKLDPQGRQFLKYVCSRNAVAVP